MQTQSNQQNNQISFLKMQLFRKKYLYNSQKPVFQTSKVKTYQCMNTQTKDQRFLILEHLGQVPYIQASPYILQPIQSPNTQQPLSVYPLVQCCSNIKKLPQADCMYILKCLLQSKQKKPLYYVLSPQGICTSQIQGLLPQRSPSLFQIAIGMLDIPQSLVYVEKSIVSKEGYQVCKGLRGGDSVLGLVQAYGWKDNKKEKMPQEDPQFWVFKGRRKDEGPFTEEYGLAWHPQHNLCRFKFIDLAKDGFQDDFYNDYKRKIDVFQKAQNQKLDLLQIYKYEKDLKGIKIFSEIPNQGSLVDYITTKHNQGRTMTQKSISGLLQAFIMMMRKIRQQTSLRAFGTLHIKNICVHNNRLVINQPLLISDKVQKKIRQLKNGVDYFSPQLKQNILLAQNLLKLDFQKMDIWLFGFMLHRIILREVPVFDSTRKPILSKSKLSSGMLDLITRCLSLTPANRPTWSEINLKELEKSVYVEEVVEEESVQKQIVLGTRKQRILSRESSMRNNKETMQREIKEESNLDQNTKLKEEQVVQQKELQMPTIYPPSPKFKRFKMILKIILVMVLYIFVFFRPFLSNSIDLLLVRGYYTTASLQLTSPGGTIESTSIILTPTPQYFMTDDISFSDLTNSLHCLDNRFNPINDPSYQLNTFIQSGSFLALLLLGWITFFVIGGTKVVQLIKGGIGNHSNGKNQRYWLVYSFYQLSLALLLFTHFYVFQFFYFSIAQPCLGITNFQQVQPFFDSSLYLFLGNTSQYLSTIFACLGILGIVMLISSCLYAWSPKMDNKNFFSIISVVFRIVPYFLLILFCRVGIFFVFTPTAINDSKSILFSLITQSFIGLIGIIPQIFIGICVVFQIGYEIFLNWVEKKVMASNKLSRLFGLRKVKNDMSKLSKISKLEINQMSIDQSKHKINIRDY